MDLDVANFNLLKENNSQTNPVEVTASPKVSYAQEQRALVFFLFTSATVIQMTAYLHGCRWSTKRVSLRV